MIFVGFVLLSLRGSRCHGLQASELQAGALWSSRSLVVLSNREVSREGFVRFTPGYGITFNAAVVGPRLRCHLVTTYCWCAEGYLRSHPALSLRNVTQPAQLLCGSFQIFYIRNPASDTHAGSVSSALLCLLDLVGSRLGRGLRGCPRAISDVTEASYSPGCWLRAVCPGRGSGRPLLFPACWVFLPAWKGPSILTTDVQMVVGYPSFILC